MLKYYAYGDVGRLHLPIINDHPATCCINEAGDDVE